MIIVTNIDNRGDDNYPFGFVYFMDGLRCAYSMGKVYPDVTGGWDGKITPEHADAAYKRLKEIGLFK